MPKSEQEKTKITLSNTVKSWVFIFGTIASVLATFKLLHGLIDFGISNIAKEIIGYYQSIIGKRFFDLINYLSHFVNISVSNVITDALFAWLTLGAIMMRPVFTFQSLSLQLRDEFLGILWPISIILVSFFRKVLGSNYRRLSASRVLLYTEESASSFISSPFILRPLMYILHIAGFALFIVGIILQMALFPKAVMRYWKKPNFYKVVRGVKWPSRMLMMFEGDSKDPHDVFFGNYRLMAIFNLVGFCAALVSLFLIDIVAKTLG